MPAQTPEADWIATLRAAVERSSIRKVSLRINVSTTVISQTLSGKYPAKTDNIEARVRAHLMACDIECPALGLISTARCDAEQRAEFSSANHVAIRRYRACRAGCPRYRGAPAQKGGAQ
jgi:hypothetical protein